MNNTLAVIKVNEDTPEFVSWIAGCRKLNEDYYTTNFPNNPSLQEDLVVTFGGPKYVRIEKHSRDKNPVTGKPIRCSIWAFVDRTNGDVLKPATFKAPAKHARGNIFDATNGLGSIGPYGPAYLRR